MREVLFTCRIFDLCIFSSHRRLHLAQMHCNRLYFFQNIDIAKTWIFQSSVWWKISNFKHPSSLPTFYFFTQTQATLSHQSLWMEFRWVVFLRLKDNHIPDFSVWNMWKSEELFSSEKGLAFSCKENVFLMVGYEQRGCCKSQKKIVQ